jgi:hypothetical protein
MFRHLRALRKQPDLKTHLIRMYSDAIAALHMSLPTYDNAAGMSAIELLADFVEVPAADVSNSKSFRNGPRNFQSVGSSGRSEVQSRPSLRAIAARRRLERGKGPRYW